MPPRSTRLTGFAPVRPIAALSCALLLAALSACGGGGGGGDAAKADGPPTSGGTLKVATDADPGSLDPQVSTAFASWQVTELIYAGLLRQDAEGEIVPDLAESYTHPDPLTYTFKLRPGLRFSNGDALTSEDVKYSFERMLDPKTASPWASIFNVIDKIQTPDERTVTFKLKTRFAPFLSYMSFSVYTPIIDEKTVEKHGLKSHAMGAGPFALTRYEPGKEIVLERNPHYYEDGLPRLDGIDMAVVTNNSTRLSAMRSGQYDLSWFLDPRTADQLGNAPGVEVYMPDAQTNEWMLAMNQTKPPFDDPDVRRAVSVAMDREAMNSLILNGTGAVGTKIPPASPFGYKGGTDGLPYYEHDPELARQLLAEAGHPDGLSTTIQVSPLYPRDVQTAEVLRDQLAEAGIRLKIVQKDWPTVLSEFVQTAYPDMSLIGATWQPDPDADVYDIFHSGSAINLGKFSDPEVDRLLEAGRTTEDVEKRKEIYLELQELVADKAYLIIPYTSLAFVQVASEELKGFEALNSGFHSPTLRSAWLASE